MDADEHIYIVNEYPSEYRPSPYKKVFVVNDGTPSEYQQQADKRVYIVNNIPSEYRLSPFVYVYIVNDGTPREFQSVPDEYVYLVNPQALPFRLKCQLRGYAICPRCRSRLTRERIGIGYDCDICFRTWNYLDLERYDL